MDLSQRPVEPMQDEPLSDKLQSTKRENPYLRRNRRLKETPRSDKPARQREETHSLRDSIAQFLSDHARLLATVATILVILTLICFVDVREVIESVNGMIEEMLYQPITMDYVHALTEKSGPKIGRAHV